jgi:predicted dehydrogenase
MSSAHEPLRLGIMGLGSFGRFSAEVYAEMPEVRIMGIASHDPEKREEYAMQWGARGHETIESLLEDRDIECVVITTPPYLHSSEGLKAIHSGRHVFFEKPLATNLADAEALLKAAQEHGVRIGIDYVMPYTELHVALQGIVSSGVFGRVVSLSLENYAANDALDADHWFWNKAQSGGIFVEHGVHFFDLGARLTESNAETIAGFTSAEPDGREDRALASVQYANGAHATYYHAFDRPEILASCALHTVFERGAAQSYGWIPTRMEIDGQAAPDDLQRLAHLVGGPLTLREALPPPGVQGSAAGLIVSATVERPSEDEEYRTAVRRCMSDFAHTVRDPDWTPAVGPGVAYESLRVAVAARASAERKSNSGGKREAPLLAQMSLTTASRRQSNRGSLT